MPEQCTSQVEQETAEAIAKAAYPTLDALFEKFEEVSETVPAELRPVHEVYARRQLHPLILSAPFAFRSVRKPLGYAGDYEIVDMILRNRLEGGSLFSKVLNGWFLQQAPAEAHRNRIKYLGDVLIHEAVRVKAHRKSLRVFNAGCGPAREVQEFIANSVLSENARFSLLDFNDETVEHARRMLEGIREKSGRTVEFEFIKKSVVQLVKTRSKVTAKSGENQHDLVYCAGLFDYLPDQICGYLISIFFEMVAPGGLLVVTNVDPSNPIRHWLASVLDWHLIYRDAGHLSRLCSSSISPYTRVVADTTGVNVFLEARRPDA